MCIRDRDRAGKRAGRRHRGQPCAPEQERGVSLGMAPWLDAVRRVLALARRRSCIRSTRRRADPVDHRARRCERTGVPAQAQLLVVNANGTVMKRARLTIAPALALVALIALGATASVRADDLPSEIVARPATLPHRMIALTLAGGYDSAHVLGISVLSTTQLHLAVQRGMTQRLEMSLASGFAVHPDAGWTRDGTVALAYRTWHRDTVELAPSLTVPLSFHSGADLTCLLYTSDAADERSSVDLG